MQIRLRFLLSIFCHCSLLFAILNSCQLHRLDVQTRYLSHENLASYHIGTPDPRLDNPTIGQRLLFQWSLTCQDMENEELYLQFKVRLRNRQEIERKIPIHTKRGYYLFDLVNKDFCESGGILTYKAEIRSDTCLIACWIHPLWRELITFDYSKTETAKSEAK